MIQSGKHCGKRRNCSFWAISSFVTMFFKKPSAAEASESVYMRKRIKSLYVVCFDYILRKSWEWNVNTVHANWIQFKYKVIQFTSIAKQALISYNHCQCLIVWKANNDRTLSSRDSILGPFVVEPDTAFQYFYRLQRNFFFTHNVIKNY